MEEIGLFPLQIVLLPTERVPLHIFEERYQELIGECLADDSEFGLVYADDEGVRDIGTRARVVQVVTRFPDGRLNVLVHGGDRFKLDELTTGKSFHTGIVSALEDEDDPAGKDAVDRALSSFEQLRAVTGSDVEAPDPGVADLSFELAGRVELPADEKLELLAAERASTNGRVELG